MADPHPATRFLYRVLEDRQGEWPSSEVLAFVTRDLGIEHAKPQIVWVQKTGVDEIQSEGLEAASQGRQVRCYDLDADMNGYVERGCTTKMLIRVGMSTTQLVETIAHEACHIWQNLSCPDGFDRDRWEQDADSYAASASQRWWASLQRPADCGHL